MTSRARVALNPSAGRTELGELPLPQIGEGDGLLEVEASGVCGTDWAFYTRKRGAYLGPIILGHETVGRVVALGDDAAQRWKVQVGDRVAVEEFLPCGACLRCRRGLYRLCAATDSRSGGTFRRYGATPVDVAPGLWGGFATHLYLDADAVVYPVPPNLEPELATLFVPVSNGIQWVNLEGGGRVGESLVVFGPGQHGLGCVLAASKAGMGPIVVVGLASDRSRLEMAERLGADATLEIDDAAGEDGLEQRVHEILPDGADVVVDVTPGASAPIGQAIAVASLQGRIILAGGKGGRIPEVEHDVIVQKELTLRGVRGHDTRSVVPALSLIAQERDLLTSLATTSMPLDRVDAALRVVGERTDPAAIHVSVLP